MVAHELAAPGRHADAPRCALSVQVRHGYPNPNPDPDPHPTRTSAPRLGAGALRHSGALSAVEVRPSGMLLTACQTNSTLRV